MTDNLTPTPRFLPALAAFRCHAVAIRGGYRSRCPNAQTDHSDLCLKHHLDERADIPVLRVKEGTR